MSLKLGIKLPLSYGYELMANEYYAYLVAAVQENVLPLTSRCNVACVFCSHRQNPPTVITHRLPELTSATVLELAPFLDPQQKIVIGESATRLDEGEPFTHPEIIHILQRLRRQLPRTAFAVTTNGTLLTSSIIAQLAKLEPLELTISLNSATPSGRRTLMNDPAPERAIRAVKAISQAGIPFHGSLVAMPHQVGWSDVNETVTFLAKEGAQSIRIFLPGHTKYAPHALQYPPTLWTEVITRAKEWTHELGVPVIPEPFMPSTLHPALWGVMQNTPAQKAGLLPGDLIIAVNQHAMRTRVEAFQTVKRLSNPELTVERTGQTFKVSLLKERHQAPGFVVLYDFDPHRADNITREINRFQATRTLLLASEFAHSMVEQALQVLAVPNATVSAVANTFFGGSIKAAGLLTVTDFLTAARSALAQQQHDLVLVPQEAFDARHLDLKGDSLTELSSA
ncbi:MAG: DUF512 domain-containing protein, partial [Firmicutes bacterium]|nr:DUF512 domain-containing protein [Bacillota bacterium]